MTEYPECEKLDGHTSDWNAIFPFLEWLSENEIWLARTITRREFYGEDYDDEPMDTMVPISKSKHDLLYEYFGVDSHKLEMERRKILEGLRK